MPISSGLTWGNPAWPPGVSAIPAADPDKRTFPPATAAAPSHWRRETSVRCIMVLVLSDGRPTDWGIIFRSPNHTLGFALPPLPAICGSVHVEAHTHETVRLLLLPPRPCILGFGVRPHAGADGSPP